MKRKGRRKRNKKASSNHFKALSPFWDLRFVQHIEPPNPGDKPETHSALSTVFDEVFVFGPLLDCIFFADSFALERSWELLEASFAPPFVVSAVCHFTTAENYVFDPL